jgi:prephenate dehydratase/chorismate mutase
LRFLFFGALRLSLEKEMKVNDQLAARRTEIDHLDRDLLRLLNRRAELASQVLALKRDSGLPICDPRRELEVLARVKQNNSGPLDDRAVETVFRQVIYETRRSEERASVAKSAHPRVAPSGNGQGQARVAFQGEHGAFSEQAIAQLFAAGSTTVPCKDFDALFECTESGSADFAAIPLENSIAGAVNRCLDLLYDSDLHIVGETLVHVSHCLIGMPGAKLEDIRTLESHPVALAQCQHFLAANPRINAVAADDTAGSVHAIMQRGDKTCAAIAGANAAKTYGAQILAERLEDHAENFTRFILVSREAQPAAGANKSALVVGLSKRTGVLQQLLAAFASRDIDLIALHPRPVIGRPWEYRFFLDLAASAEDPRMQAATEDLRSHATVQELRILGSYQAAESTETISERKKEHSQQ